MKRHLNNDLAASDAGVYHAEIVTYHYLYEIPVANGAKYFDLRHPGWARRVDLQTFNMLYTSSDILAQIYSTDSRETAEYKQWSHRTLIAHGLFTHPGERNGYDSLTVVWRYAVEDRRNPVAQ